MVVCALPPHVALGNVTALALRLALRSDGASALAAAFSAPGGAHPPLLLRLLPAPRVAPGGALAGAGGVVMLPEPPARGAVELRLAPAEGGGRVRRGRTPPRRGGGGQWRAGAHVRAQPERTHTAAAPRF